MDSAKLMYCLLRQLQEDLSLLYKLKYVRARVDCSPPPSYSHIVGAGKANFFKAERYKTN